MTDTTKHDGAVERITEMFEALNGTHKEMPVWVADAEFILVTLKTQSAEIERLRAENERLRSALVRDDAVIASMQGGE